MCVSAEQENNDNKGEQHKIKERCKNVERKVEHV
jgi:hypothetical protein